MLSYRTHHTNAIFLSDCSDEDFGASCYNKTRCQDLERSSPLLIWGPEQKECFLSASLRQVPDDRPGL